VLADDRPRPSRQLEAWETRPRPSEDDLRDAPLVLDLLLEAAEPREDLGHGRIVGRILRSSNVLQDDAISRFCYILEMRTEERVSVSAFVDPHDHERLAELARSHDRSISAELRRAIRAHVKRVSDTPPVDGQQRKAAA
jgi:hypothetical protein